MNEKNQINRKKTNQLHIVENRELNIWEALTPVVFLMGTTILQYKIC